MIDEPLVGEEQQSESDEQSFELPAKFKSVDALIQSYHQLERKLGQTTSQLREQQEQWQEFLAEQDAAAHEAVLQDAAFAHDALLENGERGPSLEELARSAQAEYVRGARSVLKTIQAGRVEAPEDIGELAELAPRMAAMRDPSFGQTNPATLAAVIGEKERELFPDTRDLNGTVNGLVMAGELARLRDVEKMNAAWRAAEASSQMKLEAQTLSGAAGRPVPEDDDESFFQRLKAHAGGSYANKRAG